jgi:hypothetical protein
MPISNLSNALLGLILFSCAACSEAATDQASPLQESNAASVTATATKKPEQKAKVAETVLTPKAAFTDIFNRAILNPTAKPAALAQHLENSSFGMQCSPATVSNQSPNFEIVLPEDKKDREHVFAVVTPGGKLYEIYTPYGDEVEEEDIIIPSLAINWTLASKQNRFALTVDELSGLAIGASDSFGIFIAEGDYQFALVSSIDKALMLANDKNAKVEVFAGCSIRFSN